MKKFYLLLFICSVLIFGCKTETEITTTVLKGKVIDRNYSSFLHLIKKSGDYKTDYIKILIKNGEFNYTLESNNIEQYQMAFEDEMARGSWMTINFFNDTDTINFTLYPQDNYSLNQIIGGKLNKNTRKFNIAATKLFFDKMNLLSSKEDSLSKINQWYTKEAAEIILKVNKEKDWTIKKEIYKAFEKLVKDEKELTSEARILSDNLKRLNLDYENWVTDFIKNDRTLFGYSLLMNKLYSNSYESSFDISFVEKELKNYQIKFKNHPYTYSSKNLLEGIKNAKVGGFYKEISALTDEGELVSLSKTITNNKLTLIDWWAPWCGPCIAKDKLLKPEYLKLKAKGFEVFAVLGAIKEKQQYKETKRKYNYPWKLNYELNHEFKIWEKYNISRSGGSQFLVNSKGKILAVNPYLKEIDSLLSIIP